MKRKIQFMALVLLGIMLSINQVWGDTNSPTIATTSPIFSGDGWTTSTEKTYTGPYLRLDANEQYVQYVGSSIAITNFAFTYKPQTGTTCTGHSGSNWAAGSISVFVTTNGSEFTELVEKEISWTTSTSSDNNTSISFEASSHYIGVKVVFNKDCGNLALKAFTVTYDESGGSTYTDD